LLFLTENVRLIFTHSKNLISVHQAQILSVSFRYIDKKIDKKKWRQFAEKDNVLMKRMQERQSNTLFVSYTLYVAATLRIKEHVQKLSVSFCGGDSHFIRFVDNGDQSAEIISERPNWFPLSL
jgi:hypothetical protein